LSRPLSPRAARILYNVADALRDEAAPALDIAPAVEQEIRHRGVGAARRTWLLLQSIEWWPLLTLRERRGFSWLPRERRRAWLLRLEARPPGLRRRAFAELRRWIESAQSSGA
jgi:hypothetical protein